MANTLLHYVPKNTISPKLALLFQHLLPCIIWEIKSVTNIALTSEVYILAFLLLWPGKLSRYSDSLQAGRSGDRIPVRARFSAPVQTSPGVHPASCTMGTGSFPGVKWPGRGADHPPPSSVPRS